MKLTVRISSILTSILAAGCFWITYRGLSSLAGITDAVELRDARGFAGFWAFLGCVFLGIALLSWNIVKKEQE